MLWENNAIKFIIFWENILRLEARRESKRFLEQQRKSFFLFLSFSSSLSLPLALSLSLFFSAKSEREREVRARKKYRSLFILLFSLSLCLSFFFSLSLLCALLSLSFSPRLCIDVGGLLTISAWYRRLPHWIDRPLLSSLKASFFAMKVEEEEEAAWGDKT